MYTGTEERQTEKEKNVKILAASFKVESRTLTYKSAVASKWALRPGKGAVIKARQELLESRIVNLLGNLIIADYGNEIDKRLSRK